MVTFKIADDDEEEGAADTHLLPPPVYDSPDGANVDVSRV